MAPDPIQAAQAAAAVVGEVMKAAGDNPNTRAAGNELGKTALTVTKAINNALLPLAAVNYAFDKAREYFDKRFSDDLAQKAQHIPPDQLVEPKASIAGPTLQALAFAHEEPELRDLYLALLTSAMDARSAHATHPAFAEVIRQLTAEEAGLLRHVLAAESLATAEIRLTMAGGAGWITLLTHLLDLRTQPANEPVEHHRATAMVDNWIRLGLIHVSYDKYLQREGTDAYSWIEERPEFKRFRGEHETEQQKVTFQRGILARTSFGAEFATAVGIIGERQS